MDVAINVIAWFLITKAWDFARVIREIWNDLFLFKTENRNIQLKTLKLKTRILNWSNLFEIIRILFPSLSVAERKLKIVNLRNGCNASPPQSSVAEGNEQTESTFDKEYFAYLKPELFSLNFVGRVCADPAARTWQAWSCLSGMCNGGPGEYHDPSGI